MQGFQIRENYSKKVITVNVGPIEAVEENDTKTKIKHTLA